MFGAAVAALVAVAAWLAIDRYLPAIDEARSLESEIVAFTARVQEAGIDIDRAQLDALRSDLGSAQTRLHRIGALLATDPLVAVGRVLPPTAPDIRGADSIVDAGRELLTAAEAAMEVGDRFVAIKERSSTGESQGSTLARLVELMATSRPAAVEAQAAFAQAKATVDEIPSGLSGPVERVRSAMAARIDRYLPFLDAYVTASERLPSILGWDSPRRYLVLTQNPAELRPTGGYIGSYGIAVFDRGDLVEHGFQDVLLLDRPTGNPYVEPPEELADYLLGDGQGWQLADANWSPHFPTSAQDARRLYSSESGDTDIDGVIGITTHTIDTFLEVTGPVLVPDYDVTIASGETTFKTLELTRVAQRGENRKAFLSAFADELLARLLALPPDRWADMLGRVDRMRSDRLVQAWFEEADDQALVEASGFDGAVRKVDGDYVYPVDSNVAPASKLHLIATRTLRLHITLDDVGNAYNILEATWENPIDTDVGAPLRDLRTLEGHRNLGMYFRVLAPERSRLESVSGGTFDELTDAAVVAKEADRAVFGAYLMIPPGKGGLRYEWISPYAVKAQGQGRLYRLTIQKQPGLRAGPLSISIRLPAGARVVTASDGMDVSGGAATLTTTFERDVEVEVLFRR